MTSTMQEIDWGFQLAMYAEIAAGLLLVVLVAGGLTLLATHLLKSAGHHRSERP